MSHHLRVMTADDIPAGMRMTQAAGWNQTALDWQRLLTTSPQGCFAAESDGRLIGTVTTISYQRKLAWIGMVLVDTAFRRRGIGRALLEHAIGYLRSECVDTIKLDATPAGQPLYEKLGFSPECAIERWMLVRAAGRPGRSSPPPGLEDVVRLDQEVFGADRSAVLRDLATAAPQFSLVSHQSGKVTGYCLGRVGSRADHLGPWVARSSSEAQKLLNEFLHRSTRECVVVDCPLSNPWVVSLLKAQGFTCSRPLTRMSRGKNQSTGRKEHVYAILGPEFG